jgi:hypothetical protein
MRTPPVARHERISQNLHRTPRRSVAARGDASGAKISARPLTVDCQSAKKHAKYLSAIAHEADCANGPRAGLLGAAKKQSVYVWKLQAWRASFWQMPNAW